MQQPASARLERDERRAQLIACALDLFSDRPFDAVSVDTIAAAAGVSRGLLYHYFPSKRELYVEAIRLSARELLLAAQADERLPNSEWLEATLDAYLRHAERRRRTYAMVMRGGIGSDPAVQEILDETRGIVIERVLARLRPKGRHATLRLALRGWVGFGEAVCLEWLERGRPGREQVRALLVRTLLAVAREAEAADAGEPAPSR